MLEMVQDLGMRTYGSQGLKKRWWIVECPSCNSLFEAAAPNIKNGNTTKCLPCGKKQSGMTTSKKAADTFKVRADLVHNNFYDYSTVTYVNDKTPIEITCPDHGVYNQRPSDHLQGKKCSLCSGRPQKDLKYVQNEVKELTSGEYSVDGTYENKRSKMLFKHTPCGCQWLVTTDDFLYSGTRCPNCSIHKGVPTEKCILYYFKVTTELTTTWKIGITYKDIRIRYSKSELELISDLVVWYFDTRFEARAVETAILNEYERYKYEGDPVLKTGNTELFVLDIHKLNNFKKELNGSYRKSAESY